MARTKAVLGSGARLSDYLSASLLAQAFPSESVAACLDRHGRNSQRFRDFHATAGVYYCMALSLYPEASYESVFSVVSSGLAWSAGQPMTQSIAKSSISALRSKIGWQPLQYNIGVRSQYCSFSHYLGTNGCGHIFVGSAA